MTPFVSGGPAISYLAGCGIAIRRGPDASTRTCHEYNQRIPAPDEWRTVDYVVLAGAGVGLTVGRQLLTLGARYEWGLRAWTPNVGSKHRVLSYLATVEWPLR